MIFAVDEVEEGEGGTFVDPLGFGDNESDGTTTETYGDLDYTAVLNNNPDYPCRVSLNPRNRSGTLSLDSRKANITNFITKYVFYGGNELPALFLINIYPPPHHPPFFFSHF
jgi:hypothetical protein